MKRIKLVYCITRRPGMSIEEFSRYWQAARQSPEWRASSEDESNFIDHSRTASFVTVEREISG